jgi:hypothetical protein
MADRISMLLSEIKRPIKGDLKELCSNNEFMGMKEAAEFLQLSISSMQKLSARRTIPVYKPSNGKVYFKRDDLLNYLNTGRQPAWPQRKRR